MQTGGEGFISKVSVPKLQMELQSLDLAHGRPKEIYTGCKHLQTQSSACYLFFYSTFCNMTGLQKDPQRTTKYKQHTSEKTPEIRSSMKQHHHLRRTPTPFCTSVSSKQRSESLHPPPMLGARGNESKQVGFKKQKMVSWVWRRSWDGLLQMFQSWNIPRRFSLRSGSGRDHRLVFHLECGQCTRPVRWLLYKWKSSICHDLSTRFY